MPNVFSARISKVDFTPCPDKINVIRDIYALSCRPALGLEDFCQILQKYPELEAGLPERIISGNWSLTKKKHLPN